jgi:hypothetical protein
MAMRLLLCAYNFKSALILAGPQGALKVAAQLRSLSLVPWRGFCGTRFAHPVPTMMRVLVAEGRRFFQELVPVRAAHVWRDRFLLAAGHDEE